MFHKQIFQPAIDGKKNLIWQRRDDRWKFQVYNSTMAAFIVCCLACDLIYYLRENSLKKKKGSLVIVFSVCFQITFGFSRILFVESCQLKSNGFYSCLFFFGYNCRSVPIFFQFRFPKLDKTAYFFFMLW